MRFPKRTATDHKVFSTYKGCGIVLDHKAGYISRTHQMLREGSSTLLSLLSIPTFAGASVWALLGRLHSRHWAEYTEL